MTRAKDGDTVRIHYTVALEDGSIIDSSANSDPFEFTIGAEGSFPGLDKAVVGLSPGEDRQVDVGPDEAFGPRHPQLVTEVDRSALPHQTEPKVGMRLKAVGPDEQEIELSVTAVHGDKVTLDANHPLAGKGLRISVELVEVL